MKKILVAALVLVLCLSLSVTAFAVSTQINQNTTDKTGDLTVTANIAPTYIVTIPAEATATYGTEKNDLGNIVYNGGNLEPGAKVKVELTAKGDFINTKNADAKIPYVIKSGENVFTDTEFPEGTEANTEVPLAMQITTEDWNKAQSGEYKATLTFTVSYIAPASNP